MTRFKYYSNYLACLLGTLIAFELCWIGAKYWPSEGSERPGTSRRNGAACWRSFYSTDQRRTTE